MDSNQEKLNQSLDFGLALYRQLRETNSNNLFLSPHSISSALALILLGSKGKTADELKIALQFKSIDSEFHHRNKLLLQKLLQNREGVAIDIANKVFPEKSFTVLSEFYKNCKNYYDIEIELLDFKGKWEEARIKLNKWINDKTKNKITDLFPVGSINTHTKLVLANAIYFKGDWQEKFKESETVVCDFFVAENETKKVKMMAQQQKYKTFADPKLDLQVVELPYKNPNFAMVLLVPNQRFGLSTLEDSLTSSKLQSLLSSLFEQDTILGLPKMKVEHEVDLVPVLTKMGVKDLFDEDKANLQNISDSNKLCITDALHKACIEVNEEGAEASAATGLVATVTFLPLPPQRIICDHPFMFLIHHVPTSSVLFLGRVTSPEF